MCGAYFQPVPTKTKRPAVHPRGFHVFVAVTDSGGELRSRRRYATAASEA
jgi:hypothetical protein